MTGFLIFVFIGSFLWALLEIQIEGDAGWAASLPCWRVEHHILLDIFYGGRPLTGYHLWAFSFVFLCFHMPFFCGIAWTVGKECSTLAGYALFWTIEDFLWFAFNPHFGLKKFNRHFVWWHRRWLAGLPLDYFILLGGAFALLAVGQRI
ncbi:MAG: hypothetical protein JO102_03200 [Elusimicrobia bacterium]|nr:hypothetical protein [Elusimicrobiota bacterium]